MNLKEAFRYQNKLQQWMQEATCILHQEENVTCTESTALLRKVNPEAENETITELNRTEYADRITELAVFLVYLLQQREQLCYSVRKAKQTMTLDFDSEVSLNTQRQEIAKIFRHMSELRSRETLLPGAGVGYKFNAEGNQVSYRCDLKRVTTINFDRNKVRAMATSLSRKSDETSASLDKLLVNTEVDYEAPFDVNDSFLSVFRQFTEGDS